MALQAWQQKTLLFDEQKDSISVVPNGVLERMREQASNSESLAS
jgi:hypothetical protein